MACVLRSVACFMLLLAACTPEFVSRSTTTKLQRPPATGTLRIDPSPQIAHVYVRDESTHTIVAVCTGSCTAKLPPGRFRLAAGFEHRHVSEYKDDIIVEPERAINLRIEVREKRWKRTAAIGFGVATIPTLVTGLTLLIVDNGFFAQDIKLGPTSGALLLAGGVTFVLTGLFATDSDHPTVEAHRWELR